MRIDKFTGLITDIDAKDAGINSFADGSVNFKVHQTYFESERLAYGLKDIPILDNGYKWEIGIETIIVNDFLSDEAISQNWIEFYIAKKKVGNIYYRQFYFKENSTWQILQSDNTDIPSGISKLSTVKITSDFFQSELNQTPKFINDFGVLKIYLAHDCFWFGKINREINFGDNKITIDDYYFDTLSESIHPSDLKLDADYNISSGRLGLNIEIGYNYNQTEVISGVKCNFKRDDNFYRLINQVTWERIPPPNGTLNYTIENPVDTDYYSYNDWYFYNSLTDENLLYMPSGIIDKGYLELTSGSLPTKVTDPDVENGILKGDFYPFTITEIETKGYFSLSSKKTIADLGFQTTQTLKSIICTLTLDRKTELITSILNFNETSHSDKYAIEFKNLKIGNNVNRRITDLKIYAKFSDDLDYELYKEFDLLDDKKDEIENFYLADSEHTGIFLLQNIGYKFDEEFPEKYKVLTGFTDIAIENKIAIAISSTDYVNLYSCAIGGGKIMSDLFYSDNIIELPGVAFAKGLAGLNGKFLVATSDNCYFIMVNSNNGLLFETIESLNIGIESSSGILKIESGVILLNKLGLFYTNGYKKENIGLPIRNIIEDNYRYGNLFYNKKLNEVYLTISGQSYYYRYRIEEGVWEGVNPPNASFYIQIIIEQNGEITYLDKDNGNVYTKNASSFQERYNINVITNISRLGTDQKYYWLDYIVLDYIGTEIYFSLDLIMNVYNSTTKEYEKKTETIYFDIQDTTERKLIELPIPLKQRVPFNEYRFKVFTGYEGYYKQYSLGLKGASNVKTL